MHDVHDDVHEDVHEDVHVHVDAHVRVRVHVRVMQVRAQEAAPSDGEIDDGETDVIEDADRTHQKFTPSKVASLCLQPPPAHLFWDAYFSLMIDRHISERHFLDIS